MSSASGDPEYGQEGSGQESERSLAQLFIDVTEQVGNLIREEIELAKTEIFEKIGKLVRGSIVGIAAGIFALLGFAMLMHSFAWLLNDLFFEDSVWLGFLVESLIWFAIAAIAGFIAYRSIKAGGPPTPDMAIEEAKRIRETFENAGAEPAGEQEVRSDG